MRTESNQAGSAVDHIEPGNGAASTCESDTLIAQPRRKENQRNRCWLVNYSTLFVYYSEYVVIESINPYLVNE